MSRQQKIVEIVQRVSKNDVAPDPEESLFDSGYLDSFALTDMVAEIEQEFGISIPRRGPDAAALRVGGANRDLHRDPRGVIGFDCGFDYLVWALPAGEDCWQRGTGRAAGLRRRVDLRSERHRGAADGGAG